MTRAMMARRSLLLSGLGAACVPTAANAQANDSDEIADRILGAREPAIPLPAAVAYARATGTRALLVRRHGVTLLELYESGGAGNRPEPLGAATRVYAALLAAALVRDDALEIGEPAAIALTDWSFDPVKQRITVRDLLTFASGVMSAGARTGAAWEAVAIQPSAAPGERFHDDPVSYQIFAEVARRKIASRFTDADGGAYLARTVLGRLGAPVSFRTHPDGAPDFYSGGFATARAFSAAGELILRRGVHRARQMVSASVCDEILRPSAINPAFGLGIWLGAATYGPAAQLPAEIDLWTTPARHWPGDLAIAADPGGARLYLSRALALSIVRLGPPGGWSDTEFLRSVFAPRG